jgi:hypothetical protein
VGGEGADLVCLAFERVNDGDIDGAVSLFSEDATFQDVPEIPGSRLYGSSGPSGGWWTA